MFNFGGAARGAAIRLDAGDRGLDLGGRLRARFASPGHQPATLPLVAAKLLALARERTATPRQVSAVLEQDPLLAGKALACAQATLAPGAMPVRTLGDALARLGPAAVRNLVVAMATRVSIFQVPGYEKHLELLRRHSLVTAHAARVVARFTAVEAEHAFLCGLLHDVGIGAALTLLGAEPPSERPALEQVLPVLGRTHQELSLQVAQVWALSGELQLVIGQHHQLRWGGFAHPVIAVLQVAEGLAQELRAGLGEGSAAGAAAFEGPSKLEVEQAAAVLGLPAAQRALALREVEEIAANLFGWPLARVSGPSGHRGR